MAVLPDRPLAAPRPRTAAAGHRHDEAAFEAFAPRYRDDERAAANPQAWGYLNRGVAGAVQALEAREGFRAEHVYSAALRGFSARLTARQIAALEDDPRVASIELDGEMFAIDQTLPWGIDQIDADASSTLAGNGSGAISNVNVYIIDMIGGHCGNRPTWNWEDVTAVTAERGAIGRWTLIVAISLHVLGTLKHVFIDRDGVLERMIAPKKAG